MVFLDEPETEEETTEEAEEEIDCSALAEDPELLAEYGIELKDYSEALKSDLVEQFKGKPRIEALMDAAGRQLQDVYRFFTELEIGRCLDHASGALLDGIGDIVGLTRKEAGLLSGSAGKMEVMSDADYRVYLIYKILKNTSDCTYPDIVAGLQMFTDLKLYYSEDPDRPAAMIFNMEELSMDTDVEVLFTMPLIRAAGVTLWLYVVKVNENMDWYGNVVSGLGCPITITDLPELREV